MNYAIPMSLLVLTILGFLGLGSGNYTNFGITQWLLRVLVALPLVVSGIVIHFLRVASAANTIPPVFPARSFLVVLTGVLEIAGAIGLFVPSVRRSAALWTSIMMVAVFPANIYAAGKIVDGLQFPGVPVRLAMQIVYIILLLLAGYGLPRPASRG